MLSTRYLPSLTLGFADGLTVPFALTVGFASLNQQKLVLLAGLAELVSGAISMALGSYLASLGERDLWRNEKLRLESTLSKDTGDEEKTLGGVSGGLEEGACELLMGYGVKREVVEGFVGELGREREMLVKFMMDFQLKLEQPLRRHAVFSAIAMGLAYAVGGLLPMLPYFATKDTHVALFISIGIAIFVLVVFGFLKARLFGATTMQSLQSAASTLVIGAVAAGASYGIVRGIDGSSL